jgi:hypothetical protein
METLGVAGIFLILMSVNRFIFYFLAAPVFEIVGKDVILRAFWVGLRFDLLVLGFVWIPIVTVGAILCFADLKFSILRGMVRVYLSIVWFLILANYIVSLTYFLTEGRHFRWTADTIQMWPRMDFITVILLILIFVMMAVVTIRSLWEDTYYFPNLTERFKMPELTEVALRVFVPMLLVAFAARGTVTAHHLERADSQISPWEIVNELALNPIWCFNK